MPMPNEFQHAGEDFEAFLLAVIDATGLATRNQAYTCAEAVLHTFRRRLLLRDVLKFAAVLPPVIRALFLANWNIDEPLLPYADRSVMTREVKALRPDHNFSPDSAIGDVAKALYQSVNHNAFNLVLNSLPKGAVEFWKIV
jgi:uncharacterized protein (DUF2267 family)